MTKETRCRGFEFRISNFEKRKVLESEVIKKSDILSFFNKFLISAFQDMFNVIRLKDILIYLTEFLFKTIILLNDNIKRSSLFF